MMKKLPTFEEIKAKVAARTPEERAAVEALVQRAKGTRQMLKERMETFEEEE
jgi:hypothetical protein